MKKKILALILTTVLSVCVTMAPVASAATAANYYDIDFDQAGDTDTAWTNKAGNGLYFGYWSGGSTPSSTDVKQTLAVDTIRGNKAVKISNSGKGGAYALGNPTPVEPGEYNSSVTWYELSFKFEDAFLPMYLEAAGYPFHFTADGSLYIGGLQSNIFQGDKVNNVTFQTDEWYHLVVAADNIDTYFGETKYYAWVNGEEVITNTTAGAGCADTTGAYNDAVYGKTKRVLYIANDSTTVGTLWLDNFKLYTTDTAVKVNGTLTYDPNVIFGGAEITSGQLEVRGNVIYAPASATLAEVSALLNISGDAVYYNGRTPVSENEMATAPAVGKTVYIRSANGAGLRKYTIAERTMYHIIDNYYDVNFDQTGDTASNWANKAGSGLVFGYCSGATSASAWMVSQTLAQDAVSGNNAAKFSISGNEQMAGTAYAVGQMNANKSGLESCVTWYELSFKFEGQFLQTYLNSAGYPFHIMENGDLYIGGLKSNQYQGSKVNNLTLELGEWYHLVIAADNIDQYSGKTKYYAWVNGEYLTTDGTANTGCTSTQVVDNFTSAIQHHLLYFFLNSSGDASLLVDNFKLYTTDAPVKNSEGELCFDPAAIFEGAELSSDHLRIQDHIIYVPSGKTLAEVSSLLSIGAGGAVYFDGSTPIAESAMSATSVVGKTVYVRSTGGVGIKKYTIAKGPEFDLLPSTALWKKGDGTTAADISDLDAGDSITLSLDFINRTVETKNCVLALAVYNGTVLADCCITDIAIPAGGGQAVSGALDIQSTKDLSVKAFVWDDMQSICPEMAGIEMAH